MKKFHKFLASRNRCCAIRDACLGLKNVGRPLLGGVWLFLEKMNVFYSCANVANYGWPLRDCPTMWTFSQEYKTHFWGGGVKWIFFIVTIHFELFNSILIIFMLMLNVDVYTFCVLFVYSWKHWHFWTAQ